MNIKLFFCILFFVLVSSCKTQRAKISNSGNNLMTIELGKSAKIPNSDIRILFQNIAEDSRCPAGVTCIWEGVAIVNMQAESGGKTENFQIATRDFAPKNALKFFAYKGYNFKLEDVKPRKGEKQTDSYITIRFEKLAENSSGN